MSASPKTGVMVVMLLVTLGVSSVRGERASPRIADQSQTSAQRYAQANTEMMGDRRELSYEEATRRDPRYYSQLESGVLTNELLRLINYMGRLENFQPYSRNYKSSKRHAHYGEKALEKVEGINEKIERLAARKKYMAVAEQMKKGRAYLRSARLNYASAGSWAGYEGKSVAVIAGYEKKKEKVEAAEEKFLTLIYGAIEPRLLKVLGRADEQLGGLLDVTLGNYHRQMPKLEREWKGSYETIKDVLGNDSEFLSQLPQPKSYEEYVYYWRHIIKNKVLLVEAVHEMLGRAREIQEMMARDMARATGMKAALDQRMNAIEKYIAEKGMLRGYYRNLSEQIEEAMRNGGRVRADNGPGPMMTQREGYVARGEATTKLGILPVSRKVIAAKHEFMTRLAIAEREQTTWAYQRAEQAGLALLTELNWWVMRYTRSSEVQEKTKAESYHAYVGIFGEVQREIDRLRSQKKGIKQQPRPAPKSVVVKEKRTQN